MCIIVVWTFPLSYLVHQKSSLCIFQLGRSEETAAVVNSAKFDLGEVRNYQNFTKVVRLSMTFSDTQVFQLFHNHFKVGGGGGGGGGDVVEVAFTTVLTEAASSQEETVSSKSVPLALDIHLMMNYDIQLTLRVAWDDSTYLWLAQVNISINIYINKNIGFI